jgi:hypothetical protein
MTEKPKKTKLTDDHRHILIKMREGAILSWRLGTGWSHWYRLGEEQVDSRNAEFVIKRYGCVIESKHNRRNYALNEEGKVVAAALPEAMPETYRTPN